jgi:transcription elongation factor Elf1
MTKFDQITYLQQLNLRNVKKTESGYNFSCPICGDSQKKLSKRRCWALIRKDPNDIIVFCHNCGYSSHFKTFLKQVNTFLYDDYIKREREDFIKNLKSGSLYQKPKPQANININTSIQYRFKLNTKYFKPAKKYEKAVEFC